METHACCPESSSPIQICSSTVVKQDTPIEQISGSRLEYTSDAEQHQKIGSAPKKLDVDKDSGVSEDAANAVGGASESGLQGNTDTEIQDPCRKTSSLGDVSAVKSGGKSGINDCTAANDHRSTVVRGKCGTDECGTFLSRIEGVREIDRVEEHISDESEDHPAEFSESGRDPKVVPNRSDTDLDYDNFDAIEVARLVAIEVKREVDCRENSGSSSDRVPGGEIQQPDSPDSACGPQIHAQEDSAGEVPTAPDLAAEASSLREEERATSAGSLDAERINGAPEMECSQVTDVAQELPANPERGLCNFDLNQEVCSDDVDRPENPSSMPISIVSASRAAAAPGMPVAPLQFEGALGWKGSAATSAFRPASPRRIPEADKAHSTGGSNSSSKQRDGCLDIDLNADESLYEKPTDPLLQKQIPVSSGLPSGESSVEASPRRLERIELDLNRVSDDGVAPSDWRTEGLVLHQRNGYQSQSPSSSSSSRQPSLRNIDLNLSDQPSSMNDSSDHPFLSKLSQSFNAPGAKRSDDSVISIMGMRVEVNRKDPQSLPSLNGRRLEPALDANVGRTGGLLGPTVPYTHSPVYGYSGPTVAFTSAMYGPGGPIPYMLDSRGTPIPQVMGSAPALPPVFSHQPILLGMTGTTPALNGAGPPRNSFDLNSGLILEGGNRDTGSLRQYLSPGQPRLMDDPFNSTNSQASTSSGAGVKRKEPDSGWEIYPSIRHNPPPWK
ncbi:unnamed protein product [Coffea canephora]|uniref:Uncharacterized protein n=1 Tax=Coffea canephora TaxID=49390 RepID=A0A068UFP2_COFCA|nr:unnamed protein product [Coffea canephora]